MNPTVAAFLAALQASPLLLFALVALGFPVIDLIAKLGRWVGRNASVLVGALASRIARAPAPPALPPSPVTAEVWEAVLQRLSDAEERVDFLDRLLARPDAQPPGAAAVLPDRSQVQ